MEKRIVECVPNFSEGRDKAVIRQITSAIESSGGVKLLAVVLTLFIMGGWLSGEILRYADDIFSRFYMIR